MWFILILLLLITMRLGLRAAPSSLSKCAKNIILFPMKPIQSCRSYGFHLAINNVPFALSAILRRIHTHTHARGRRNGNSARLMPLFYFVTRTRRRAKFMPAAHRTKNFCESYFFVIEFESCHPRVARAWISAEQKAHTIDLTQRILISVWIL